LHFSPTSLCGGCFSFCIPPPPSRLLRHPLFDTHNFHTYHLSHTTLSHSIFHTQLCHTASFAHNFVTQHLSHTTLSHSIFHTQLCHTPPFTHNFVTHVFHTQLCGTWRHPHSLCVAGMALIRSGGALGRRLGAAWVPLGRRLGAAWAPLTPRHFVWQVLCLATCRRATYGTGLALVTPRHFAWQAWHLTFHLRGRCGDGRSICVAGVALLALGWLWWRAWGPLVAGDAAALCMAGMALGDINLFRVAGVALGDIELRCAWQAWRFATWQAWHLATCRRGTCGTGLALVVRLGPLGRR